MGIEEIVSRIKQEAHEKANRITAEARKKAEAERRKFERELEEKRRILQEEMEAKLEAKAEIIVSEARRKARAELLRAKESLIQQAVDTAVEKLRNLSSHDHQQLIVELVNKGKKQLGTPCWVAVSREEDRAIIQGIEGVRLMEERAEGSGGILIFSQDKKLRVDYTFEGIVKRRREELRSLAARLLFTD